MLGCVEGLEAGQEDVLLVPPKLAQSAYQILIRSNCVARPWHLEGRFGSRTHPSDDEESPIRSIGIPVMNPSNWCKTAELEALLEVEGVRIVHKDSFVPKRVQSRRQPPAFDARIHPERAPQLASNDNHHAPPFQKRPAFTYAELFAGIGGFGVALEALGGTCVFCSELEPACRDVYAANFPDTKALYGDIYQVTNDELPKKMDLLVGGFPCQPFSSLGQQPGLECPKGGLFLEIVRVLKVSRPTAFLLENVPGLWTMKETRDTILQAFESAGYTIAVETCNSRGLTATSRKRLFFVGLRQQDRPKGVNDFEFPYVPDLKIRSQDVVDYGPLADPELEDLLRITDEQLERLCSEKHWRPSNMVWPDGVCNTLVSHYGNSITRGDSQLIPGSFPRNPRRFSPRECARIMGFPNSFRLPEVPREGQGPMAHCKELYRMFGNAVCPPLVAAIAGAVLAHCNLAGNENEESNTWLEWGRATAIRLAFEATVSSTPKSQHQI